MSAPNVNFPALLRDFFQRRFMQDKRCERRHDQRRRQEYRVGARERQRAHGVDEPNHDDDHEQTASEVHAPSSRAQLSRAARQQQRQDDEGQRRRTAYRAHLQRRIVFRQQLQERIHTREDRDGAEHEGDAAKGGGRHSPSIQGRA